MSFKAALLVKNSKAHEASVITSVATVHSDVMYSCYNNLVTLLSKVRLGWSP